MLFIATFPRQRHHRISQALDQSMMRIIPWSPCRLLFPTQHRRRISPSGMSTSTLECSLETGIKHTWVQYSRNTHVPANLTNERNASKHNHRMYTTVDQKNTTCLDSNVMVLVFCICSFDCIPSPSVPDRPTERNERIQSVDVRVCVCWTNDVGCFSARRAVCL